ncbi:penicillin acylase family protein [Providencia rettgeri]|nr:penicillin acylase family protein [Providencia rettgeri]EJD6541586.1 penicillin acylase family protein [Providencia rettgeri]ELQ1457851.1 penicillin acylase family protein [Providencia rettgeri]ELQ1459213.1 penicillin acylase family protein [Providencia rettgeri]ELR5187638.1 penicillin acylase family protein [Providencia rettgeri]
MKKKVIPIAMVFGLTTLSFTSLAAHTTQVKIERDSYGVPHIYADDTYSLFYGYGYAVAQDRLFQMEMAKRSTQGTVSEVLGKDYIAFDKDIRTNYWPDSIHQQITHLPTEQKDILKGYADGMNAWIKQVNEKPNELMPKQFIDYGFLPSQWDSFDVAMIMVGTMANRFSDMNSEIDNLALLTALKDKYGEQMGVKVFDQINWLNNPNAPTTISPQEFTYSDSKNNKITTQLNQINDYRLTAPMFDRPAKNNSGKLIALSPKQNNALISQQYEQGGANGIAGYPTTSNIWLVGKNKASGANAILLNGPQFGWFNPAYTYGIGLHGAGFNIVGNTPFAYPAILFGHNGHISWGSTAGFGDGVDIFAEEVSPENPNNYLHQGQWKKMLTRQETINVKGEKPVTFAVYRTVNGNIIKRDDSTHTAYSKSRAWDGKEVSSLMAWVKQGQAQNWQQWLNQAKDQALTINWYYADKDGNIGYVHTGHYPDRQANHDPRLPVPGTGDWDWKGMQPFENNPKVYNPKSGYIANWNNSPAKNYPASDLFAFLWGSADRVTEIDNLIDSYDKLTSDDMWNILQQTSRVDLNRRLFMPYLSQATEALPASDNAAKLVSILKQWDGINQLSSDGKHYIHPGSAILDIWLKEMLKATLGQTIPAPFDKWYLASGYETTQEGPTGSLNISTGAKLLYESLLGNDSAIPQTVDIFSGQSKNTIIRKALDTTYQKMKDKYGDDPANWQTNATALTFRENNFFGVPQALAKENFHQNEYHNRGTENDLVVFTENGVQAWDVVAPGQSGFISPQGKRSPHYQDQLSLYNQFGKKPLWLDKQELAPHIESTETLTVYQ